MFSAPNELDETQTLAVFLELIYANTLLVYEIHLINKTYTYSTAIFQKQMRSVCLVGCSPSLTEQPYYVQPFQGFSVIIKAHWLPSN